MLSVPCVLATVVLQFAGRRRPARRPTADRTARLETKQQHTRSLFAQTAVTSTGTKPPSFGLDTSSHSLLSSATPQSLPSRPVAERQTGPSSPPAHQQKTVSPARLNSTGRVPLPCPAARCDSCNRFRIPFRKSRLARSVAPVRPAREAFSAGSGHSERYRSADAAAGRRQTATLDRPQSGSRLRARLFPGKSVSAAVGIQPR